MVNCVEFVDTASALCVHHLFVIGRLFHVAHKPYTDLSNLDMGDFSVGCIPFSYLIIFSTVRWSVVLTGVCVPL